MYFLAIIAMAAATTAKADDMHPVPLTRDQWPATAYYDVGGVSHCVAMGGQMLGKFHPSCRIAVADCEKHAGYTVVMRDGYGSASGRFAACHKMK